MGCNVASGCGKAEGNPRGGVESGHGTRPSSIGSILETESDDRKDR